MAHNIGGNRELLIDNALIDTARTTAQEVRIILCGANA